MIRKQFKAFVCLWVEYEPYSRDNLQGCRWEMEGEVVVVLHSNWVGTSSAFVVFFPTKLQYGRFLLTENNVRRSHLLNVPIPAKWHNVVPFCTLSKWLENMLNRTDMITCYKMAILGNRQLYPLLLWAKC